MKILAVTNNKSQLLKSPSNLSVIASRDHEINGRKSATASGSSDISFFVNKSVQNTFAQVYKNNDLIEIWRLKRGKVKNYDDEVPEHFERILKFKEPGVQAIAAAKNNEGQPEYAIGYTNGRIIYGDLRGKNRLEFPTDPKKASVLSMDINSNNQYLASVYENGSISVFGIKTNVRTTQLDKVKEVTSVRFSPSNRYHLAAATYNGHVYLFDFNNNNKQIFHEKAHDAPCRDVSMSLEQKNLFYTCGLDSFIKIFDVRKKNSGLQISLDCGLTTISVEPTGNYIVAGNLKGNVMAFDFRQLKRPLSVTNVDDDLITRVSFLPTIENSVDRSSMFKDDENISNMRTDELPIAPVQNDKQFIDEIHDYSRGRVSDFEVSVQSRVSFIGTEPTKSEQRKSDFFGKFMKDALSDHNFNSMFDDPDSNEQQQQQLNSKPRDSKVKKSRKSSFLTINSPLQRIREEKQDKENFQELLTPVTSAPRFSSTPATVVKINVNQKETVEDESLEVIDVDAIESPSVKTNCKVIQPNPAALKVEFDKIHEKIKFEVQSLNMDMFQRHIELTTHMTEQRMKLQERVMMIEDCMAMLMNDDFKINKIMELQRENQDLRRDMNELIKRINNIPSSNTQI